MKKLFIAAFLLGALIAFAAPASASLWSECYDAYDKIESLQNHLLVQTRLSDYETACNDAAINFMQPEEFKIWYGNSGGFFGKKGVFFLHCLTLHEASKTIQEAYRLGPRLGPKTIDETYKTREFEHYFRLAEKKAEAISSSCPAYNR